MNTRQRLIAALVTAFAATGAFAGEANADDETWTRQAPSVKSRAEVKAELAQLRAEGALPVSSGEATVFPGSRAGATARSRDAVKREAAEALRGPGSAAPINVGG